MLFRSQGVTRTESNQNSGYCTIPDTRWVGLQRTRVSAMLTMKQRLLSDSSAGMCAHCFRDAFTQLGQQCNETPHMLRRMRVPNHCRRCYNPGYLGTAVSMIRKAKCLSRAAAHTVGFTELRVGDEQVPFIGEDFEFGHAPIPDGLVTWETNDDEIDFYPEDVWIEHEVEKIIFLPTEVLTAAISLVNKAGATAMTGAKPPNDWLQIANLVTQTKHQDPAWDPEDYAFALCTVGAYAITDEIQCSMPSFTFWDCFNGAFSFDTARDGIGYAWSRYRPQEGPIPLRQVLGASPSGAPPPDVRPGRPNVGPPPPPLTPPPGLEEAATVATEVDEQMGAYVNDAQLHSTTVTVEHGDHVQDNRTATGEIGQRTARARFPKASEDKEYLFSNDPECLVAAEKLRNDGVGEDNLSPEQAKAFDAAVDALKKHLFTKSRVKNAERFVARTADVLPKNRSDEAKMQMHIDALNEDADAGVPFSILVDAFTKKEVSGKWKPRAIVNHGNKRVFGMAKSSAVFEDVMFHGFPHACIKHAEKHDKMNDIFSNLESLHPVINDLSAFDFGIHERLKQAECDILKHIMSMLDLDADNAGFCHRVVDARTKACTWVLRYRDAAGAWCTLKLKLPRTMRESGDRITSSGNFLQNLLAWFTFLVKHDKVEAAIQDLIRNRGRGFRYVSARDGRTYRAYLAFEGDDTVGGLEESIILMNNGQLINQFFTDHGWKAKLEVISIQGDACVTFVGYTALLRNGRIVKHGTNVVMFPEIKRILRDKPWTTTDIPDCEFYPTVAVYATCMANEFRNFLPMHAFFTAMREDHLARGGEVRTNNAMLRDLYVKMHGEVGTDAQVLSHVPDAEEFLDGGKDYYDLAKVHAGDYTPAEVSSMCGLTTLEMHGRDLACLVPPSWLGA